MIKCPLSSGVSHLFYSFKDGVNTTDHSKLQLQHQLYSLEGKRTVQIERDCRINATLTSVNFLDQSPPFLIRETLPVSLNLRKTLLTGDRTNNKRIVELTLHGQSLYDIDVIFITEILNLILIVRVFKSLESPS